MPRPSDPCRPLRGGPGKEEVTLRDTQRRDEGPSGQEYPTPDQQLIEADKKRRRKLATLARDHIMKLREEWERMAHDWDRRVRGAINLSMDFEEELDFNEDERADLSEYSQNFEWNEVEYMRLRFIATRHYASRGHWDDAYAYVLRTRRDNIPQHEDTYSRNAEAWHYTNARINELVQEAEQILEAQDRQMSWGPHFRPPRDSLIPPGHSTGTPSPIRSVQGREQESRESSETTPTRRAGGQDGRTASKSPHSPNKESQKEE